VEKINSILGSVASKQSPANSSDSALSSRPVVASSAANLDQKKTFGGEYNTKREYYPHRRRRAGAPTDLTKIKGILSKVLAYRGLDKKVERYEFILHWRSIVGERLFEVTRPDCIRNRTLFVHVLHPVWAQELTFMKPVLLQKLVHYLKPGDVVSDIVFRVGDVQR
jgi:predicted nucleic acid-binding Zn ribbon protein